jgi:TPR repeat protein
LTKAVEGGDLTAIGNLGVMYAEGWGIEPDIKKARSLFSRAAELGSRQDARNDVEYEDDGRDDTLKLQELRTAPLVQALGMPMDYGIAFLAGKGVISDTNNGYVARDDFGRKQVTFEKDGVVLLTSMDGRRITNVEGRGKGSLGEAQYTGKMPFGLTWEATFDSTKHTLGVPDDFMDGSADGVYAMAYRMENVCLTVVFYSHGEKQIKLWRVYEKWAEKYPAP